MDYVRKCKAVRLQHILFIIPTSFVNKSVYVLLFTGSVDPNLQSPAHNVAGSQGRPYSNHASVQGSPPRDGLLLGVSTYSKFDLLILFI